MSCRFEDHRESRHDKEERTDVDRAEEVGDPQAPVVQEDVLGIRMVYLEHSDVVRHPLVSKIIQAYENKE